MEPVRLEDARVAEASASRLSQAFRSEEMSAMTRWVLRKGIVRSPRSATVLIGTVGASLILISLFFWL